MSLIFVSPAWWHSVLAAFAIITLAVAGVSAVADERNEVLVRTGGDTVQRFDVEIADTPQERQRGLMDHEELARGSGMLFDFKEPQRVTFWMKDTEIPLDMLFIDANGRIVKIHRDAEPMSRKTIPSGRPVLAVLEVRAGTAARLNIQEGDRVLHPIFMRSP